MPSGVYILICNYFQHYNNNLILNLTSLKKLMINNNNLQIGQKHGGFFGMIQQSLASASPHIWFERAEQKDRNAVSSR